MPAHGHAPGGCEGSVAMGASFRYRTLIFCRSFVPRQFLSRTRAALEVRAIFRLRHTSRLMPGGPLQATPGSDVGDATCA